MTVWLRLRGPLDRVTSLILGLLIGPLLLLLMTILVLSDGFPATIGLSRVGRRGELFILHKLRSMRVRDPDNGLEWGPITRLDDDRITRVGRWLRHYRLDELPQLFNVIRGDMLLLGPRPETPEYVDKNSERWRSVLTVRPGIAGPTQVLVADWEGHIVSTSSGKDPYRDEVLPVKLAIDEWYVNNAGPVLDIVVLISLLQRFFIPSPHTVVYRRLARDLPEVAERLVSEHSLATES